VKVILKGAKTIDWRTALPIDIANTVNGLAQLGVRLDADDPAVKVILIGAKTIDRRTALPIDIANTVNGLAQLGVRLDANHPAVQAILERAKAIDWSTAKPIEIANTLSGLVHFELNADSLIPILGKMNVESLNNTPDIAPQSSYKKMLCYIHFVLKSDKLMKRYPLITFKLLSKVGDQSSLEKSFEKILKELAPDCQIIPESDIALDSIKVLPDTPDFIIQPVSGAKKTLIIEVDGPSHFYRGRLNLQTEMRNKILKGFAKHYGYDFKSIELNEMHPLDEKKRLARQALSPVESPRDALGSALFSSAAGASGSEEGWTVVGQKPFVTQHSPHLKSGAAGGAGGGNVTGVPQEHFSDATAFNAFLFNTYGAEVSIVAGDGHCQFQAVAQSAVIKELYDGDSNSATVWLRGEAQKYLHEHKGTLADSFVTCEANGHKDYDAWVDSISTFLHVSLLPTGELPSTKDQGSELTLRAMAAVLNRSIIVLHPDDFKEGIEARFSNRIYGAPVNEEAIEEAIYVVFNGVNHYDAIVSPSPALISVIKRQISSESVVAARVGQSAPAPVSAAVVASTVAPKPPHVASAHDRLSASEGYPSSELIKDIEALDDSASDVAAGLPPGIDCESDLMLPVLPFEITAMHEMLSKIYPQAHLCLVGSQVNPVRGVAETPSDFDLEFFMPLNESEHPTHEYCRAALNLITKGLPPNYTIDPDVPSLFELPTFWISARYNNSKGFPLDIKISCALLPVQNQIEVSMRRRQITIKASIFDLSERKRYFFAGPLNFTRLKSQLKKEAYGYALICCGLILQSGKPLPGMAGSFDLAMRTYFFEPAKTKAAVDCVESKLQRKLGLAGAEECIRSALVYFGAIDSGAASRKKAFDCL
ncbi:MAG: hypothetical protein NTV32_07385, partial [Gammaproteobacteria bacterium]|nr:hypothetical protein [Gammaproteobacteria bacterium]